MEFDLFIIIFYVLFFGASFFIFAAVIKTFTSARKAFKDVPTAVNNQIRNIAVNTVKKEADKNSHAAQMSYSQYYSEKPIKDSGIHDGPLSEAERNVLYGK